MYSSLGDKKQIDLKRIRRIMDAKEPCIWEEMQCVPRSNSKMNFREVTAEVTAGDYYLMDSTKATGYVFLFLKMAGKLV